MGVWIETIYQTRKRLQTASHPVWVCGLKPSPWAMVQPGEKSHPVWVCGLKPHPYNYYSHNLSHTLYGCVD